MDALILGIVEGITEFLPVSSTGHLILTSTLMHLSDSEFLKSFEIAIQLGAMLSVVVLYWKQIFTNRETFQKIVAGFLPTGILGLLLYKTIKQYLLGNEHVVVIALILGGIVMILLELWIRKRSAGTGEITYRNAFLIGLFQSISMIPGVSRSAATIIGGLCLGIDRAKIVEFSFLLALPTMAAATGLDLIKSASSFSSAQFEVLAIGFIVSWIVALLSIKFLLRFIQHHTFIAFGIYRIIAGIIFWMYFS